jgi:putative endonuclease
VADGTRTPAQRLGDTAESLVADRLAAAGWTILARNVRVGRDELDLIAIDPGPPSTMVVVEVRWRARRDFGLAEETVDGRKRSRLRRAAWRWLEESAAPQGPVRFDLVVVEPAADERGPARLRHHRAAF